MFPLAMRKTFLGSGTFETRPFCHSKFSHALRESALVVACAGAGQLQHLT